MISRRRALSGVAGGVLASPLLLSRSDAAITPALVRLRPEIEPLVSLIERTPRERCAEMAVDQLRRGVSYRQLLAALFLAGVRNVNPRPPGFALHCVFVIHSAHLLALEAPPDARLLPFFYALDNFKIAQERDAAQKSGDYNMGDLTGPLPPPPRAGVELLSAMDAWDAERAERAAAALARYSGGPEAFSLLWSLGARDYRNIGHKAIYVANAYSTLQTIGWQHAEPVLRSLALSLADFGRDQRVNGYAFDDQCYAGNLKRVRETLPRLNSEWAAAPASPAETRSVLEVLRSASPADACADLAGRLSKSGGAASIWDAIHLAAAELRMRLRPAAAIIGIHAVTSASALHHAYLAASGAETRYLLLLQAAGWVGQFRVAAEARPENLRRFSITEIEPATGDAPPGGETGAAFEPVFSALPSDPDAAAAAVLRFASGTAARQAFFTAAIRHTLAKADEVHYLKYLASLIEDVPLAGQDWQPRLAAASVYYMKGAGDAEALPMKRAREALRALPA